MSRQTRILGVLAVAALVVVGGAGVGFATVGDGTGAVAAPETASVGTQICVVADDNATAAESFDVRNLSAPAQVEPGETVTVTADIYNPNDVPMIQDVEFRLEGDVVERRGWALNPNETETITFTVNTTGLAEGTYVHGIETRDNGEVTTLEVTTEPAPTASVQFDDQTTNGSTVTVASTELSDGGFVAVHDESGAVVGVSEYLDPGAHENVSVTLDTPLAANATLTAMPHLDTNDNETFDFITSNGSEDGPYTADGAPVTDDAMVTVEQAEPPTTETPTTTTETPTTTTTEVPTATTEEPPTMTETTSESTESG